MTIEAIPLGVAPDSQYSDYSEEVDGGERQVAGADVAGFDEMSMPGFADAFNRSLPSALSRELQSSDEYVYDLEHMPSLPSDVSLSHL